MSTSPQRYFVSQYTDGPATRWNVIDRQTQEWIRRFPTEAEAQAHADNLNQGPGVDERPDNQMKEATMDQFFLDEGAKHPVLGPHYFAARQAAEDFMASFEPSQFEPMVKKAADAFMEQAHESLENWFLSNVESNLQGTIWRQIDDSVKALLGGERWALERYALGERYDCEKIRAAVAKHIAPELQDKRIADLEAENKILRERIEMWQR